MDATTGSLGQGLSIAIGHSIGKNLRNEDGTIFCILGDGELQEGQIWEALLYYPKTTLNNLICIVDWNKGQNDGYTEDFSIMYENIDGHDMEKISNELGDIGNKPVCLILDTVKGKGVSFMEHPSWHCKVPTDVEYEMAMKELGVLHESNKRRIR